MRSLLLAAAVLVAGCGGSAPEGPCSAPGEACGGGLCAQPAYCDSTQHCVPKLEDGARCTEPRQCAGAHCDANECAGGEIVCRG